MAHYAEIDRKGIVKRVIVADIDFIMSGRVGNPNNWIKTSYNTSKGRHKLNGFPLRKNFAGVGYTYDKDRDAFIPPKRYKSWVLNEETCNWEPPKKRPNDGNKYRWNENRVDWEVVD